MTRKEWAVYISISLVTALLVITLWFLYHVYFGRLS